VANYHSSLTCSKLPLINHLSVFSKTQLRIGENNILVTQNCATFVPKFFYPAALHGKDCREAGARGRGAGNLTDKSQERQNLSKNPEERAPLFP
jgi:hypothetical protein